MTSKVCEWVNYGPLEVLVVGKYDFKVGEWDQGPMTEYTSDHLEQRFSRDLYGCDLKKLGESERETVGKIVLGIEHLAGFHKFSKEALESAREAWLERGGE